MQTDKTYPTFSIFGSPSDVHLHRDASPDPMHTLTHLSALSFFQPELHEGASPVFVQQYVGPANQRMLESIIQLIEETEELGLLPISFRKRLILVLIEGLQNSVKYGMRTMSRHPMICFRLEVFSTSYARVCFGNYIHVQQQASLADQLQQLKRKTPEALKQLYILRSREKVISRDVIPSAGLGLIEITRCAASMRYRFQPESNAVWFELETEVR